MKTDIFIEKLKDQGYTTRIITKPRVLTVLKHPSDTQLQWHSVPNKKE